MYIKFKCDMHGERLEENKNEKIRKKRKMLQERLCKPDAVRSIMFMLTYFRY